MMNWTCYSRLWYVPYLYCTVRRYAIACMMLSAFKITSTPRVVLKGTRNSRGASACGGPFSEVSDQLLWISNCPLFTFSLTDTATVFVWLIFCLTDISILNPFVSWRTAWLDSLFTFSLTDTATVFVWLGYFVWLILVSLTLLCRDGRREWIPYSLSHLQIQRRYLFDWDILFDWYKCLIVLYLHAQRHLIFVRKSLIFFFF